MTEAELHVLRRGRKTEESATAKRVQTKSARSFFVEAMKESTASSYPRILFLCGLMPVLSPQGVVEVLRRQWTKMKPEERAPYEEMERNYRSRQLSDMQAHFPR